MDRNGVEEAFGSKLVRIGNGSVKRLSRKKITIPPYIKLGQRKLIQPGVIVFGTSNLARSLVCKKMEQACEADFYNWGVSVISTRSSNVVDALNQQDRLFVAVEKSREGTTAKLNGVICEALFAPKDHDLVMARLIHPETKVVMLTTTQAGYYLQEGISLSDEDFQSRTSSQWLDTASVDINHDIQNPTNPKSVIGYIVESLRLRREAGLAPYTIVSCDNMPRSGTVTKNVVLGFAEVIDHGLAKFIDRSVDFCDSVVDRITPAARLEESCQWLLEQDIVALHPVTCEPYARLIISDNWRNGVPEGWEAAGVEFMPAAELDAWRQVKQRLLNGGHVNAAIAGALMEYSLVDQAISDPQIQDLICGFMEEAVETLCLPPNFDFEQFRSETLERFLNSALPDELKRVGRFRCRKVSEHVIHTAEKQVMLNGVVGQQMLRLITLWIYSMTTRNFYTFLDFPEDDLKKVHEMCQSMWENAWDGNCSLMVSALRSRNTFPDKLKEDEGFCDALCSSLQRLSECVRHNDEDVPSAVREFLRPLH